MKCCLLNMTSVVLALRSSQYPWLLVQTKSANFEHRLKSQGSPLAEELLAADGGTIIPLKGVSYGTFPILL